MHGPCSLAVHGRDDALNISSRALVSGPGSYNAGRPNTSPSPSPPNLEARPQCRSAKPWLVASSSKIRSAAAVSCPCSQARSPPAEQPPFLLRLLQRRSFFQAAVPPDRLAALPNGEKLVEKILGLGGGRIRLDGILPPVLMAPPEETAEAEEITVTEVRKVLRAAQMEVARAKLRAVPESCVSYSQFLQICCDVSSAKQGPGIARSLDESGAVIVLGDAVLLRPDQELKVRLHGRPVTATRTVELGH